MDASKTTQQMLQQSVCPRHGEYMARGIPLPNLGKKPGKIIWLSCPECTHEAVEREAAQKILQEQRSQQKRIEELFDSAAIPKRFQSCSFDNYIADSDEKHHALSTAKEFAMNFNDHARKGSTLVFAGKVGTGKAHLAVSAAKSIMSQGHSAFFITARGIVLKLRARWDDSTAPGELVILEHLTRVSLLVIDEIGVQFNSESERNQLFGVIDGRYQKQMPTILTTNLDRELFKQAVGVRSFSRLREEGKWVPFEWEDFRAKKALMP